MKNLQTLLQDIDQLLDSSVEPPKPTQDSERIQESPEPIEEISTDVETDTLLATLRENFGHADFRENQREIAQAILDGENLLAAFPTGYGKSLCYQLPALMLPGITVVVSPLISLMKDQVDGLREQGIHSVALINSSLSIEEYQWELERLKRHEIKLLYIAPERFRSRRFLDQLDSASISLFVIDEAHCISQWGHDFRPAYLALREAIRSLHPRSIALFTATATPEVRKDILGELEIEPCRIFSRSIERPNLKFSVHEVSDPDEKYEVLIACLEENEHRPPLQGDGIVYAGRRRETEEIADYLKSHGYRADYYHAGRTDIERKRVQERFFDDGPDGLNLVVATNAFGMGIDKSNIRYIIHWTMTGTLEDYYQQAGRAGRDGETAYCVMLYCPDDRDLHEWFIDESAPNKLDLLKLLKLIETFPAVEGFHMIAEDELEWLGDFKETKIRVGLSYLERLGFLRRQYNVASKLSVRLGRTQPTDESQRAFLRQLSARSPVPVLDFCREFSLRPDRFMEQLIDLQSDGHLRYWGSEDLMLIELLQDSNLFANISEDQMGFEDYLRSKRQQIDYVIRYALTDGCRGRFVRQYFGEPVEADYRCGSCEQCDQSYRLVERNSEME